MCAHTRCAHGARIYREIKVRHPGRSDKADSIYAILSLSISYAVLAVCGRPDNRCDRKTTMSRSEERHP
jgi:hypothetical protein